MDEKQKKRIRSMIHVASGVVLAAVIAYMAYLFIEKKPLGPVYMVVICGALLLFWLLETVLAPILCHSFEEHTPEQIASYKKYAALELLGYGGLAYFALSATSGTGIYGALVYVVTLMFKRRFLDEYLGKTDDEDEAEDDAEEKTPAGSAADREARMARMLTEDGAQEESEQAHAAEDVADGTEQARAAEDAVVGTEQAHAAEDAAEISAGNASQAAFEAPDKEENS